jgi:hypothetical protein
MYVSVLARQVVIQSAVVSTSYLQSLVSQSVSQYEVQ